MRLTRRGRILLVVVAAVLLVVVFSIGRASSHASGPANDGVRSTVVLQRGETLWHVARRVAPKTDPRVTVQRLIELNGLAGADGVQAGQEIVLPA